MNTTNTRAVWPLLAELGFKRRAGEIFTVHLAEDVIGWLGLNRATRHLPPGEVEVYPIVGIRHQGVERVVAELLEQRFHPYVPPTVSTPLSVLYHDRKHHSWFFSLTTARSSSQSMAEAISEYGMPFLKSSTSLVDVCRLIEQGVGHEHQLELRRPVAWQLAGRPDLVAKALGDALEGLGERKDPAVELLRRFGDAFQRKYGSRVALVQTE